MKLKGGDSNKKFQNTFFKHQVKNKMLNNDFQNKKQNRNKFFYKKNYPLITDTSNEIITLNVIALMPILSQGVKK